MNLTSIVIPVALVLLGLWAGFSAWMCSRFNKDDRKFWESYRKMYDCSGEGALDNMADKALYLAPNPVRESLAELGLVTKDNKVINMEKYMNWLKCLNVAKLAFLARELGHEHDIITVRWDNDSQKKHSLLLTTVPALTIKPPFLAERPVRIYCEFKGGPPNKPAMEIRSSLLNFIVDRVFLALEKHGKKKVDAMIIQALNHRETLLLEGPVGA